MQPSNGNSARYGIEELAEIGGVSRRTVRYYVQRGLLPAPTGTGRGQHYTDEHLQTLVRIRQLQESGVPLSDIPSRLVPEPVPLPEAAAVPPLQPPWWKPAPDPREPSQSLWTRIVLADGVELHLRGRIDATRAARLADAVLDVLGPRQSS